MSCAAIAEDTFANVARTVVQRTQKCADVHGGHFCPLEVQLMAPCEDLPHINMDKDYE